MGTEPDPVKFSEEYGRLRSLTDGVRETPLAVPEYVVQCIWYDQLFAEQDLRTDHDQPLKVVSPGWWNHQAGPDFKGAQLEFDGNLRTGDVEVHLDHAAWKHHGHGLDARYDEVLLVVVLDAKPPTTPPATSKGRRLPCLLLAQYLDGDVRDIADRLAVDEYPYLRPEAFGQCSALVQTEGAAPIENFLQLAGEWRMLNKARALRERMDRAGPDQAVYEAVLTACGFSHFKHHFRAIARQLPYERARQLARQDPLLLEAAFLQIAGLLPVSLPEGTTAVPHFARLRALRRDYLGGLRSLPLTWRRVGVRPNNNPERRLAGAARFIARTAADGLTASLDAIWQSDVTPIARRRAFEGLFPNPTGFWATHCTWTGAKMQRPTAPLGPGRVRSIIGNAFIPAALALARRDRDRTKEERVYGFFAGLSKEADNQILKAMIPRIFGEARPPRLTFRLQQGLLQMYQDWCQPNPSCRACSLLRYLQSVPRRDSPNSTQQ